MGNEEEQHDPWRGFYHGLGLTVTLAAAFSLVGIVLLIIILRFYVKYLLGVQHRRRHQDLLYRISTQIAPTNVNVSSAESPNCGLDPVIIASLPKILYKQTDQFSQGAVMECTVCLGTIVEDAAIRVLPNCQHMFHVDCVDKWFSSNSTCPVCRALAEPCVQPAGHDRVDVVTQVQPTAPPIEHGGVSQFVSEMEKRWVVQA